MQKDLLFILMQAKQELKKYLFVSKKVKGPFNSGPLPKERRECLCLNKQNNYKEKKLSVYSI